MGNADENSVDMWHRACEFVNVYICVYFLCDPRFFFLRVEKVVRPIDKNLGPETVLARRGLLLGFTTESKAVGLTASMSASVRIVI